MEFDNVCVQPLRDVQARLEAELFRQALNATEGNHTAAAKLLGISRATFYRKLARQMPAKPGAAAVKKTA